MARTMSEGHEELIREVVAESVLRAESGGTLYAAPLLTELDAERAAHEATRNSIKTCPVCGEETSTVSGHLMAEEIAALKARLALAEATINTLHGYAEHGSKCVLSRWEAGRPTPDGGYEWKYAGMWYDADNLPACECDLGPVLAAWRAAK